MDGAQERAGEGDEGAGPPLLNTKAYWEVNWLELRPSGGPLAAQLEAHRAELSRKEYGGLHLRGWEEAEFARAFVPLLPPRLRLEECRGVEGTVRSRAAVGGGQEACEGSGAPAGEGPGLRHLQVWDSALTELPRTVGLLTSLRTLSCRCEQLAALPEEVGLLTALHTLDLTDCSSLEALPVGVLQLPGLRSLYLSGCTQFAAVPLAMEHLTALHSLNLSGCTQLATLPGEVRHLRSLRTLELIECTKLRALPEEVGLLTSLQYLNLSNCKQLAALPVEVCQLSCLRKLLIYGCSALASLPWQLGRLQLDYFTCSGLRVPHATFLGENRRDWPLLRRYFLAMRGAAPLHNHRVLLIGDGGAGKSTLARALALLLRAYSAPPEGLVERVWSFLTSRFLRHPRIDDERLEAELAALLEEEYESTHGVHLLELRLPGHLLEARGGKGGQEVVVRLVDFAGQLEYLHTHWLFFSGVNSLYAVVSAMGDEDGPAAYRAALVAAKRWLGLLHGGVARGVGNLRSGGAEEPRTEEVALLEKLASLVVTRGDRHEDAGEHLEDWLAEPLERALDEAGLPGLASCSLLDYGRARTLKACLDQMVASALALESTVTYPPYCATVLAAVQELYKGLAGAEKAEARCPLATVEEILGCCTVLSLEEVEVGLKVLHSVGEVVLVEPHRRLEAASLVVLEPLGWLSSTVALFVRREDQGKSCGSGVRLVPWDDNPKHSVDGEAAKWGWIKRKRVERELQRYNAKERIPQIIDMLLRWSLCFQAGEYLVWPLRFTSTAWKTAADEAGPSAAQGPGASTWTAAEALGSLLVRKGEEGCRMQGAVLWSGGPLVKIPPALFSMVVVQLCASHGYEPHQRLESYQEQVVLCRGRDMALLLYSLEEARIRVVVCGPGAEEALLEIVVAFKEAQERHFCIQWRYGLMCGHCLLDDHLVETAALCRASLEVETGPDGRPPEDPEEWRYYWELLQEVRCDNDPTTSAAAATVRRWLLHGRPVAREGEDGAATLLRALLPLEARRKAFLGLLAADSLQAAVSKHRTWMGQGALEVVVRMFPAVVRLQAGYRRYGTGFLATFDRRRYIVTARHVLQHLGTAKYDKVTFLYSDIGERQEVPLSEVVDMGGLLQNEELDVAVLPVTALPQGIEAPVFELAPRSLVSDATVSIIHHPNGDIAKVDTGAKVTAIEATRVFHALETDDGSSGAPVFVAKEREANEGETKEMEAHVVAVHCGTSGKGENYGAPIGEVVAWLEKTLASGVLVGEE